MSSANDLFFSAFHAYPVNAVHFKRLAEKCIDNESRGRCLVDFYRQMTLSATRGPTAATTQVKRGPYTLETVKQTTRRVRNVLCTDEQYFSIHRPNWFIVSGISQTSRTQSVNACECDEWIANETSFWRIRNRNITYLFRRIYPFVHVINKTRSQSDIFLEYSVYRVQEYTEIRFDSVFFFSSDNCVVKVFPEVRFSTYSVIAGVRVGNFGTLVWTSDELSVVLKAVRLKVITVYC